MYIIRTSHQMSRVREPQSHGLLLFRLKVDEDAVQGFSRWQFTCTSAIDGRSHENTRRVESPGHTHIIISGFDRTPTTSPYVFSTRKPLSKNVFFSSTVISYFCPANRFRVTKDSPANEAALNSIIILRPLSSV